MRMGGVMGSRWGTQSAGLVLIAASLFDAGNLIAPDYAAMFSDLPPGIVQCRYWVSVAVRLAGVAAGVGVLRGSERGRRLAVALGWFTVATVLWKHPRGAIERSLLQAGGGPGVFSAADKDLLVLGWTPEQAWGFTVSLVRAGLCLFSAAVFGGPAWYLSRPGVRAAFGYGASGQAAAKGGGKPQERKPSA